MKNPLQLTAKSYASCAKKAAISAPNPITPDYAELLIGIGTCEDWLRWAFELRTLDFARLPMRRSNRAVSFLESTRFTFARTAANALFSRDAILSRFGSSQLPRVEFDRFTLLCDIANIGVAERDAYLATLHSTLDILRTPDQFPWTSSKHVRIIELIYYKYTPDLYKGMGKAGLAIKNAATGKISTRAHLINALIR